MRRKSFVLALTNSGSAAVNDSTNVPDAPAAVFPFNSDVLTTVFAEDDAWDAWISVIPDKHWSVTAAYVDLGRIADRIGQRGWYLSLQLSR